MYMSPGILGSTKLSPMDQTILSNFVGTKTAVILKQKLLLHGTLKIGPSSPLKSMRKQKEFFFVKEFVKKSDNFVLA